MTTTYPAGTTLHCHLCGATTVVMVDGTRGAWCTGRRVGHARVEMVETDTPGSEPEVAPSSKWR